MAKPTAVAVFASGGGTNLQSLLDRFGAEGSPDAAARIALVISDRPGIGALEHAEKAGVPTRTLPPKDFASEKEFAAALLAALAEHGTEIVALAGYLKLVPEEVVQAFRGKMVNIHPGPLPTFGGPGMYGHHVHDAVIAAGVRVSGPTIHFVDERYDTGPIIAQWPVPVLRDDTAQTLAARVLKYEHRLYPAVIAALAKGEIQLSVDGRVLTAGVGEIGYRLSDEDSALTSVDLL